VYKKLIGTYASEDFANALVEMKIVERDTPVEFCFEYFNDAIETCFEERKLMLLLYADLLDDDSVVFIKQIFEDE